MGSRMMIHRLLTSFAGILAVCAVVCPPLATHAADLPSRPGARRTADYINRVDANRPSVTTPVVAQEEAEVAPASHEVIYEDGYMPSEGEYMVEGGQHQSWIQDDCTSCGSGCNSCGSICGLDLNFGMPCGKTISYEAQVDYLLWWRKGSPMPPLVTTGGASGASGTGESILFGGKAEDYEDQSGARISLGIWLDDYRRWNLSARYWQLGQSNINFAASGNGLAGSTLIARPFFNASAAVNAQDSELVNEPGVRSGFINIDSSSDVLGGDLMLRYLLQCCGDARLDFVTGYQFSRFDENLTINSSSNITATNLTRNVSESFDTRNEFHGGILGLKAQYQGGGWTLDVLGKVGLGNLDQTVTIAGATQNIDAAGGITNVNGGLLTQTSNIGVFNQSMFTAVPELNVNLAYQVSCNMRVALGYSMIYWSEAVQPGRQIDTRVDPTQTTALPAFDFDSSDFWVQGLNFGLQWDY